MRCPVSRPRKGTVGAYTVYEWPYKQALRWLTGGVQLSHPQLLTWGDPYVLVGLLPLKPWCRQLPHSWRSRRTVRGCDVSCAASAQAASTAPVSRVSFVRLFPPLQKCLPQP